MPAILHEQKYFLQRVPRHRLRVNWSHPLTLGLVGAYAPIAQGAGAVFDLVNGRRGAIGSVSNPTWVVRASGPAVADGTNGSFTLAETANLAFTSGDWTIAAWYSLAAAPASGEYVTIFQRFAYTSESNNQGWQLSIRPPSDGQPGYAGIVGNNNGALSYVLRDTTFTTPVVGDQFMAHTSGASSQRDLYRRDDSLALISASLANTTNNRNPAAVTTGGVFTLGNTLTTGKAYTYVAMAWARKLPQRDVMAWFEDPMAVLVDEAPVTYFLPAAPPPSSSPSLQPNAGALTLTGLTPGAQGDTSLTPSAGALALTGQPIPAPAVVTPGAGALALTGRTPVVAGLAILPGAGSLGLTGRTPGVVGMVTTLVTPGTGGIAFASDPPLGSITHPIQPGPGMITFASDAPDRSLGVPALDLTWDLGPGVATPVVLSLSWVLGTAQGEAPTVPALDLTWTLERPPRLTLTWLLVTQEFVDAHQSDQHRPRARVTLQYRP